jgi:enoyl-CoA hydratase/carnithine racemase
MPNGAGYQFLKLTRPSPGVLLVTLSRPERLNAIDDGGHAELLRILSDVDDDPDARVAVFTGAGRAFCAGGDVSAPLPDAGAEPRQSIVCTSATSPPSTGYWPSASPS